MNRDCVDCHGSGVGQPEGCRSVVEGAARQPQELVLHPQRANYLHDGSEVLGIAGVLLELGELRLQRLDVLVPRPSFGVSDGLRYRVLGLGRVRGAVSCGVVGRPLLVLRQMLRRLTGAVRIQRP